MDKIKAFFQSKTTQIVAWVILVLDIITLALGGVTQDNVSGIVVLIFAVIAAVAALIAGIGKLLKSK